MENLVNTIKEKMDLYVENAELQVKKGNKAAGARARKIALELMKDRKEFRKVSVAEAKKENFSSSYASKMTGPASSVQV